ncbi:alkylation response protein AidB-like acyl-CoA dehydrogenase [Pseudomonas duriflava]|uniref:3-methylmercaptopropionyl-CoA dehydrogenase n=1 Tax=Pseudomonas duriflava TaxID=459528 RepID=A0A562QE82_9PSED|nr:acyl-CoA dehydrogenase family protein [Pseudomonas duriflava]TWI55041.1 alkylation response protein AidB-like acyl-CoA dehydrogenase [Pseudomonas duriflava]
MTYQPPLRDMQFVIEEWLNAPADWKVIPSFRGVDAELSRQVLEEAGRFTAEELAPLNAQGDRQGCQLEKGQVSTPEGFAAAYQAYVNNGWPALACDPAWGGQGLPQLLDAALQEMLASSNHAWAMYPGIAHGAYECLRAHASPELKDAYLGRIVSGEWLATMCLTEPQAGSDVGLIRTRAEPQGDGSYQLEGNKIFISGGEHDLTDNIVHLVLARLPNAPAGSRGLSLFLVPKRLEKRLNGVYCEGIEHKMGIKGSATCALRFEGAQGWLIGEPQRGLAALFVMMNSARLHVGLQGLGHVESAWQQARSYAAERRQMRAVPRSANSVEPADLIQEHPALRRTLLELRAVSEGLRALGYWGAHLLDQAEHAPEPQARAEAHQLASLLTPIIKAFFTEQGFQLSSAALQVFGGYGYVNDFGIEQTLRDSRITMIYEGTNEIQANDLLIRKVLGAREPLLGNLLDTFRGEAELCGQTESCRRFGDVLIQQCERVRYLTDDLMDSQDPEHPYRAALDYLRLLGWLGLAFAWARTARLAAPKREQPFYRGKWETATYVYDYLLVNLERQAEAVQASRAPLPFLPDDVSIG